VAPPTGTSATRRAVLRSGAAGAVAAWVLFLVVISYGTGDLLHRETFGGFYDAQTRALLDGRLDVDPDAVRFEGFRSDGGRVHMYQGLLPSLGRLPIMVLTDRFDGRFTGVSMALAMAVALAYLARLVWTGRRLVRGEDPVGPGERAATAALVFGLGASPLLFLASKAWVYHEALLWGAALAIGSLTHLLSWLADLHRSGGSSAEARAAVSPRPLVLAAVVALLAVHARFPLGLGAVAALGLVGAAIAVAALLARRSTVAAQRWVRLSGVPLPGAVLAPLLVAAVGVVAALGSYGVVNGARFGTPFGVPIERQGVAQFDPGFLEALAANDGSLFGLQFVPSQVLQVLRPDAIGLRSVFPFLGFPEDRPTVVGDAVFAELDWSASLPASAPLLVVLGLVGLVAAVASRQLSDGGAAASVRLPALGALVAASGFAVIGYIAHRYLVDITPMLAILAAVGAAVLGRWTAAASARPERARWWSVASVGLVGALALWGAWANASLAVQYQREIAAGAWAGSRAAWVGLQSDLGPTPSVTRIGVDDPLPQPGPVGELLAITDGGDCRGLYRSNDRIWMLVEGGPDTGSHRLRLTRTAPLDGPVVVLGGRGPQGSNELVLEPADDGRRVRLAVRIVAPDGTETRSFPGSPFELVDGESIDVRTELDWRSGFTMVRTVDDRELFSSTSPLVPTPAPAPGGAPGQLSVSGRPLPTPVCDRL
jgi:hypothetical protein